MTRVELYRTMLKKTEAILKRQPTPASELAKQLRTSRQTAYSRIEALKEFCTVEETFSRVGSRGPVTTLFFISSGSVPDA